MNNENLFSNITGSLSILCWVIVFTPQIYENYRNKSGDSLSLVFLWIWLAGDIFNIVGVAMEQLLPTILVLGVYYAVADSILIGQVYYYRRYKRSQADMDDESEDQNQNDLLQVNHVEYDPLEGYAAAASQHHSMPPNETDPLIPSERHMRRKPIEKIKQFFSYYIIHMCLVVLFGMLSYIMIYYLGVSQYMGWTAASLFIVSRIPQIVKNFAAKSMQGLSLSMFLFAILGNVFFCASIFLQSSDHTYIMHNLPWLVGSAGTLTFDVIVAMQFLMYRTM